MFCERKHQTDRYTSTVGPPPPDNLHSLIFLSSLTNTPSQQRTPISSMARTPSKPTSLYSSMARTRTPSKPISSYSSMARTPSRPSSLYSSLASPPSLYSPPYSSPLQSQDPPTVRHSTREQSLNINQCNIKLRNSVQFYF